MEGALTPGDFSRKEARDATDEFVRDAVGMRHKMRRLHQRRAHRALGYVDNWGEYLKAECSFDGNVDGTYRTINWAQVEVDLFGENPTEVLTQSIAMELWKLPQPDRKAAYQEALTLAGIGRGKLPDVKHIVTRLLGKVETSAPSAVTEPEPEVPVGALVNVYTGRATEPDEEEETPAPRRTIVSSFSPEPDVEPSVVVPHAYRREMEDNDLPGGVTVCLSADSVERLEVFRRYYKTETLSLSDVTEAVIVGYYAIRKDRLAKYE